MPTQSARVTERRIKKYLAFLAEQEKSPATLGQYAHSLRRLTGFLQGGPLTKAATIAWKESLTRQYAPASVNAMLAAANGLFAFYGWAHCRVRPLKIQKDLFCRTENELSEGEFARLVCAARQCGNQRLVLMLQTLCTTGIRVSELQFITAEAVRQGRAAICCKGKRRVVFLPKKLRRVLQKFLHKQKRTAGAVFVTKTGKPLDRSNIWREMKRLCKLANVAPGKVFPHNLRHLFARTFYSMEKDLSRLADILGHSSTNTTRIYMVESGAAHARQVERMSVFVT